MGDAARRIGCGNGQVLRFGLVGGTATLVHLAILLTAVERAGLAPAAANALAFAAAALVTYLGQAFWVFGVTDRLVLRLRRFVLTAMAALAANVALMALAVGPLGQSHRLGFALVVLFVPAATFLANRGWVFRRCPS